MNIHPRRPLYLVSLLVSVLLATAACSNQRPAPLGKTVRQITDNQVLNPDAGKRQAGQIAAGMDGQIGENVLRIHREHVAKPVEVKNEIQVNIGN